MTRPLTAMEEAFLRLPPTVLRTPLGETIFKVAVRRAESRANPRSRHHQKRKAR